MIWFLSMVVIVSLSGVMMPGPVFAACVVKGYRDSSAGLKIALGHALVEIPVIILLVFGLKYVINNRVLLIVIGVAGGIVLVYMGLSMVRFKSVTDEDREYMPYNSLAMGLMTTAANPYFYVWWATVGAALIAQALGFPAWFVAVFMVFHLLCDFIWDFLVSFAVYRSRKFWTPRVEKIVFAVFGFLLVGFGIRFVLSPFIS
ncbi:LysE family transporter [candidate division KSB1 bacterium]